MTPIPGIVEAKAADGTIRFIRKWFNEKAELKKENALLKAQLNEREAFERELATLECSPSDDNIYWAKDGSGAAFCPLCIRGPQRLFTPLTGGIDYGKYYCKLHDHPFETEERRNRLRDNRPRATRSHSWRAIKQRLEAESMGPSGPHGWMAK